MATQTTTDFTWLVLCDESTDPEILVALRACRQTVPALELALTSPTRSPRDVVRSRIHADADIVITTCLDSDDAISDRFVETVRAYADPFARSDRDTLAVNFPRGYRLDCERRSLYLDWMANSSFASLFERPRQRSVETVLSVRHVLLCHSHFTHQDESLRAWLIAVHGDNLINRIPPWSSRADAGDGPLAGFPASVMLPPRSPHRSGSP